MCQISLKRGPLFIPEHLENSVRGRLTVKYEGRVDKSSQLPPPLLFLTGLLESVDSENGGPQCLEINKTTDSKLQEVRQYICLAKWYISLIDPIARHTIDSVSQPVGYVHTNCSETWNKLYISDVEWIVLRPCLQRP